jgi:hypothetical protein
MFKLDKTTSALLAAVMLSTATVGALPAAALAAPKASGIGTVAGATPIYWRRGFGWWGPGPAAAILGGVIIGGAITAAAVAEHRAEARDIRRCGRDFPGFDPRSGTYVDPHGEVRVCPYLY